MQTPLPSKTRQKKCLYQPSKADAIRIYRILNKYIVDNSLTEPSIAIRVIKYWGLCLGYSDDDNGNLHCKIKLYYRYPCVQFFTAILAHEMAHQHQWEIHGPHRQLHKKTPLLSHGPSFYTHRVRLAEYGIPLRRAYGLKDWLRTQNLMKL